MGEISLQLAMIRKKYDVLKQENAHKRNAIERLTKDLEKIGVLTSSYNGDQCTAENTYNQVLVNLESNKKKLEEEMANEKTYKHIYNRINEERITLEVKSNQLHNQYKSVLQVFETEKSKCRKNFEAINASRNSLKCLKSVISYDNKQKQERISSLEKTALSRKEAAERREDRIRKIAEIADVAANENTDTQEISIKQSLLLHKIWHSYLKYKLDMKLKGAIEIEDAYQSIRSATGLQNINEIVNNFIGKEENQSQLIKSITEANNNLDHLKLRNEKCKSELKELILIEGNQNAVEFLRKIREIDEEIFIEKKNEEKNKEEFKNLNEFYDEIITWSKTSQKNLELGYENNTKELFETMTNYIKYELSTISTNREQFLKEWSQPNELSTEKLIKMLYQDSNNYISSKLKSYPSEFESSISISFADDDKRKKSPKKIKIV